MHDEDYQPIDCGLHSEYELAIMPIIHSTMLNLSWHNNTGTLISATVKPLDLKTRDKQEFLVVQWANKVIYEIRLDRIIQSDVKEIKQK